MSKKPNQNKKPSDHYLKKLQGRRIIKWKVGLCDSINVKQLFSEESENWKDSVMMDYEFEKSTMEVLIDGIWGKDGFMYILIGIKMRYTQDDLIVYTFLWCHTQR